MGQTPPSTVDTTVFPFLTRTPPVGSSGNVHLRLAAGISDLFSAKTPPFPDFWRKQGWLGFKSVHKLVEEVKKEKKVEIAKRGKRQTIQTKKNSSLRFPTPDPPGGNNPGIVADAEMGRNRKLEHDYVTMYGMCWVHHLHVLRVSFDWLMGLMAGYAFLWQITCNLELFPKLVVALPAHSSALRSFTSCSIRWRLAKTYSSEEFDRASMRNR